MTSQDADASAGRSALDDADPDALAQMIAVATDDQIAEGMAGDMREEVLDDIFRRMGEHFDADAAKGASGVVHWKILDRPDGGYDHYELRIADGSCTVSAEPVEKPRATFKISGVPFIRLVSGNADGPKLFLTGKLQIKGDLFFAARVQSFFKIPGKA